MSAPEPAEWDLDCYRGVDFEFAFTMDDPTGKKIIFTGCSAWLTVYADQQKTTPILTLKTSNNSIAIVDGDVAEDVDVKLVAKYDAIDTAELPVGGHIYDYDVQFTDGQRWRIFEGNFTVNSGNLAT